MFSAGFQFDDREFAAAVLLVITETDKAAPVVINKAALHVIIGGKGFLGAMQLTPKADKSKIKALSRELVSAFVANKLRAEGKLKSTSADAFQQMVSKEIKRRVRAIGYTAFAGWNNAAKAFGGTGLKNVTASPKKLARLGYGEKARKSWEPTATLTNTAPWAEKIGTKALEMAITNVARDMQEHQLNKMATKIFDAVAPKL